MCGEKQCRWACQPYPLLVHHGAQWGGEPTGELGEAILAAFGSFDALKTQFEAAGATRFGSGWAWLVVNAQGRTRSCLDPQPGQSGHGW